MSINFDTANIILCVYPTFAGGKFLKNCLGLSDNVVFQDSILAEKQLLGNFVLADKMKYLLKMLDQVDPNHWNDLKLGCAHLFGSEEGDYYIDDQVIPNWKMEHVLESVPYTVSEVTVNFKPIIESLSHSETKFILGVHQVLNLQPILDVWKNAVIIVFTNTKNFRRLRRNRNKREIDWVGRDRDTYAIIEKSKFNNNIFYFNNDSYFNEDDTVNEVRNMYHCLNLTDFNEQAIREYYKNWIIKCIPAELIKNY
jgi:hypothetical protein